MKYDKIIETLFKTKKYNKILAEYNKLTTDEKQILLNSNKVKKRIFKIADIYFLLDILIDLKKDFIIDFLSSKEIEKFSTDEEKILIDFLKLEDYENFDKEKLKNIKDIKILTLIFRKFSNQKLKNIILEDYDQIINDCAFIEYSKKSIELNLDYKLIEKVSDTALFSELKRRKLKNRNTNISIEDFLNLSSKKQNDIFINGIPNSFKNEFSKKNIEDNKKNSKNDLIRNFNNSMDNINYIELLKMQSIIYSVDDETATELINLFFKKKLFFDKVDEKYLNSMIYNFRKLENKTDELFIVSKLKPFSIIYYLNTNCIDKNIDKILNKIITIDQYQKINIKKINKINKLVLKLFNDKEILNSNKNIFLSYKLYLIFGYETSIELLNGKFGTVNYDILNKLLDKCDVKNVEFASINKNYEPILNKEFLQFIIGDKKDNNTTIKKVLRGQLDIVKNEFHNLYNNFNRFQATIGNKIHLNKLIPLLEKNPFFLLPNEYKITKDMIDNIIKSYGYEDSKKTDIERLTEACTFYHNYLEKRITSSIPRVIGKTQDKYTYEILKLDDPLIMTLGYLTKCCFRLDGLSKDFLRYCSESPYARVIVIKNENNEICSMIPIIRNGNVVSGNSIETNSKGESDKVYHALKCAYDDILEISSKNEDNPIVACLVTNLHKNCYSRNHIRKKIFPIRNDEFYTNYDAKTYIVSRLKNISEKDFKLYVPNPIYYDERPEILVSNWRQKDSKIKQEINNRTKSILYQIGKDFDSYSLYTICSEDWFLKVNYDGISGECLKKDPRAQEEFDAVKKYLQEKFNDKGLYNNLQQESSMSNDVNSIKSKQLTFL